MFQTNLHMVVSCDILGKYVVFLCIDIIQAFREYLIFYEKSDYFHNEMDKNIQTWTQDFQKQCTKIYEFAVLLRHLDRTFALRN